MVQPLVADQPRLVFALDDTPTPRSGPHVQGAGIHHNPTPGPTGSAFLYGHQWVALAVLVPHPRWGVTALPRLARLSVRATDLGGIDPWHRPDVRTKLELAVALMRWAKVWLGMLGKPRWVVVYTAALSARTHNPPLRAFAGRLAKAGKAGQAIITAVARKLVAIANAILQKKGPWQPQVA